MESRHFSRDAEDRLPDMQRLLLALLLWGATHLLFSVRNDTPIDPASWYHVDFAAGGMTYLRMADEAQCRAHLADETEHCLRGTELLG